MSFTPSKPAISQAFLSVFLLLLASAVGAPAQTFTNLYSFVAAEGANPYYERMVQGVDGNLYGTTYTDGANGNGTVFKITPGGTLTTIYNFCAAAGCADGALPEAGLTLGTNGNFYGTTATGGASGDGTIFEVTPAGKLTTLHSFDGGDGSSPQATLLLANDGNFYGTTTQGGVGVGTVFKITAAGKFTLLHTFNGDGAIPQNGSLVEGANGNFYGTTTYGGTNNDGTVYKMTPAGKLTTLHSFCSLTGCADGLFPVAGLVLASNGNFYGTTERGGNPGNGTVFEMNSSGTLSTLYTFCALPGCPDGDSPAGTLIQGTDGNLYGETAAGGQSASGGGTIFQITLNGVLTTLYNFCSVGGGNCFDGNGPMGTLFEDTSGTLYGTTYGGGTGEIGTVFSVTDGLPAFIETLAPSGKVGARATILGSSLTGSTSVSFNGTLATTFKVISTSEITATIPAGASTGSVQVATPGGTLSTLLAFKVIPQLESFTPPRGAVGSQVVITGVSLTQTSKVTFGGVAAAFTVNSDTQVTATVPAGAKTGKIVITTPGGTASSTTSFTVTT